ncbi:1-pyrroline-5-carboxylate dehydrogenase 2 [Heracleum sosnowskyi]|uniref:1-pyrroline-5-carboxylate dehydrogenase 2 n=1 Tax=Heracleum sosnowskyi TaxID=360622 RepID=A0AAD8IL03_9APIA|nr:1-pyrroline-5-carboxylate dehydrogenase 2 [Heracleum sosnowskyi]
MEGLSCMKRVRQDSDESVSSQDVKRLKEDLLNMQDESYLCMSHDLDSFIQSFENEILGLSPVPEKVAGITFSGESQPELGFLLEASDDELGLPPSTSSVEKVETELVRVTSGSPELSESWGYVSGYDSFDLGYGDGLCDYGCNSSGEFVTVDGLFDYSDMGFGSSDILEPKTLPAL